MVEAWRKVSLAEIYGFGFVAKSAPFGVSVDGTKILPQYEADDGPLTVAQIRQIKKRVPQGSKRSVRSSLLEKKTA